MSLLQRLTLTRVFVTSPISRNILSSGYWSSGAIHRITGASSSFFEIGGLNRLCTAQLILLA